MNHIALFFLAAALVLSGCRSRELDKLPEVKPLPGEENVRVTLEVDISNKAPAEKASAKTSDRKKVEKSSSEAERTPAEVKPVKRKNQVILSVREQKKQEKKRAKRRKKEFVPSGVGIIDSDLNSVEQSYLREVRSRREQQVRSSEQQIFGSFSPSNIFNAPAD